VSGFDKDSGSSTVVGGDGNGFVQEAMKLFDTDGFMVATSSNMDFNVQGGTSSLEKSFESAAVIDDD
jgi:hypothetical protein